jgi:hypothetical protein
LSLSARGQRLWKCKHCPPHRPGIYHCSSTTHISQHLRSQHDICRDFTTPTTCPANGTNNSQQTLSNLRPNGDLVRKTLVSWILGDHQAFRQIESPRFKQFLTALIPLQSNSLLPA